MLDDRDYMRSTEGSLRQTATFHLIAALAGIFLVQAVLLTFFHFDLAALLSLDRRDLAQGQIWRLVTFQFVHACPWPWHVLFNCLALYFMGQAIEGTFGRRRLLHLFFLGGLLGGVLHLAATFLPHHGAVDVIGASGGALALLGAYATLNPGREMCFVFLFFPVRLRADVVLWFLLGLSVFEIVFPFGGVSGAAHLGGLLFGIGYARRKLGASDYFPVARLFNWDEFLPTRRSRTRLNTESVGARSGSDGGTTELHRSGLTVSEDASEDFISKEVDPILDKISAHGIHSLTDKERKILEKARTAMAKRS